MRQDCIMVSIGAKGHRVLVNGIQRGIEYNTAAQANKEAVGVKDTNYPHAKLYLAQIPEMA